MVPTRRLLPDTRVGGVGPLSELADVRASGAFMSGSGTGRAGTAGRARRLLDVGDVVPDRAITPDAGVAVVAR